MYITPIHRNTGITFLSLVTTYYGKVKEKEKKHEKRRCTVEQKVRNKKLQWFVFAKKEQKTFKRSTLFQSTHIQRKYTKEVHKEIT